MSNEEGPMRRRPKSPLARKSAKRRRSKVHDLAVENARLLKELEARNRDLTEALDQQTATSEVLKVISRPTFELQPVLEILIEHATRLCGADRGQVYRVEAEALRYATAYGVEPEAKDYLR